MKLARECLDAYRPSTATVMSMGLRVKGIGRNAISGEHLIGFYSSLAALPSAPDFDAVENLLSRSIEDGVDSQVPLLAVIVETRPHPALEAVVENVIERLAIPVQIFHGSTNLDFIRSTAISRRLSQGSVRLTPLGTDALSAPQYNALLLSPVFWETVLGRRKILIFQTDSIICRNSDYSISEFMEYDYIGSKWPRRRPIGIVADGGNGGLSLRDWGMMMECLTRFRPELWRGGEDGFFAFHSELLGGRVGKNDACAKFGTQYEFCYRSFGAHKISCLGHRDRDAFLRYSPEAGNASEQAWPIPSDAESRPWVTI